MSSVTSGGRHTSHARWEHPLLRQIDHQLSIGLILISALLTAVPRFVARQQRVGRRARGHVARGRGMVPAVSKRGAKTLRMSSKRVANGPRGVSFAHPDEPGGVESVKRTPSLSNAARPAGNSRFTSDLRLFQAITRTLSASQKKHSSFVLLQQTKNHCQDARNFSEMAVFANAIGRCRTWRIMSRTTYAPRGVGCNEESELKSGPVNVRGSPVGKCPHGGNHEKIRPAATVDRWEPPPNRGDLSGPDA